MRIKKPGNPKAKCSYENKKKYDRKEKYKKDYTLSQIPISPRSSC